MNEIDILREMTGYRTFFDAIPDRATDRDRAELAEFMGFPREWWADEMRAALPVSSSVSGSGLCLPPSAPVKGQPSSRTHAHPCIDCDPANLP